MCDHVVNMERNMEDVFKPWAERSAGGVSDHLAQLVNEPTVGLFFIKQHVRTAVPFLDDKKVKSPC